MKFIKELTPFLGIGFIIVALQPHLSFKELIILAIGLGLIISPSLRQSK